MDRPKEAAAWLVQNAPEVKTWVSASDASTKGYLQERISTLGETDAHSASEIAEAVGVSIPTKEDAE
jgi:hypothetical protein